VLKERLPKEVRLNGTCSSGADDDRNDRDTIRDARNQQVESGKKTKKTEMFSLVSVNSPGNPWSQCARRKERLR